MPAPGRTTFSRNVILLAIASFLADVSGEMLLAVLPFLLVSQGASGVGIGLVGGFADAIGHALKPVAGRLADATGKRKPLIMGGYLLAALSRVGIALASAWPVSLAFRASDRVGKGLRTAPRDALLAESAPKAARGRAFGFHRAADTAGAVAGVSLALAALSWLGATPQAIVLAGAAIGLGTLVPLVFVREVAAAGAEGASAAHAAEPPSPRFGGFVALAGLFALGNVSYMFYMLRASGAAGAPAAVALYLAFNLVYFAAAYPAGRLSDRVGKERVLLAGWTLFALASLLFLAPPSLPLALAGFALLGVAFGAFEGTGRAFAADLAGARGRGARLGVYHATIGLCTVAGGLAAGLLWDRVGEWAAFAWAGALSLAAAGALGVVFVPRR